MKSFGGLWPAVVAETNLEAAMRRAACGKLGRGPVREFVANAALELPALRAELISGAYLPQPYTQFRIRDPKPRTISCAAFRDRVVHHALCDVCAPCIERRLIADTYACRTGKGSHRAVLRAQEFVRRHRYFLKLDIRKYFDSVDVGIAENLVRRLFREPEIRRLWSVILRQPLPGAPPGLGLPIGNLTSQWLANLYLDGLDHVVKEEWQLPGYIRYMDDVVVFADSKELLWLTLEHLRAWLDRERRLAVKGEPRPVPCAEGLPFLGFRVFPGRLRIQRQRLVRFRRLIRQRERAFLADEITEAELVASARAAVGILAFFGFRRLAGAGVEV